MVGVELCCPGVPTKQVLSEGEQRMVLLQPASFQEVPGHTWHPFPVNSQGISPPASNPTTFSSQFYIPGWRLSLELFTPMADFLLSVLEVTWSSDVITYFGQNKGASFWNKISLFTQSGSESCSVRVWLFATPWTIESMEFSRPEYWSGQPFLSPGNLPNPGMEPRAPRLQADSLPAESQGKSKNTGGSSWSLLQ